MAVDRHRSKLGTCAARCPGCPFTPKCHRRQKVGGTVWLHPPIGCTDWLRLEKDVGSMPFTIWRWWLRRGWQRRDWTSMFAWPSRLGHGAMCHGRLARHDPAWLGKAMMLVEERLPEFDRCHSMVMCLVLASLRSHQAQRQGDRTGGQCNGRESPPHPPQSDTGPPDGSRQVL